MRFQITALPAKDFEADWHDLYKIPLDLFRAIFWLTPKAVVLELLGRDSHDDHDQPIDNKPGWNQVVEQGWPKGIERHYFDAESTFDDIFWHAIDGYQFRIDSSFPALEELYFEGKNLFPFKNGFIGQALRLKGENLNCPLLFVNIESKEIQTLIELDGAANVSKTDEGYQVSMPRNMWLIKILE